MNVGQFSQGEVFELPDFRSPKRSTDSDSTRESSFPYYAGYSEAFTRDVLSFFASPRSKILDPWNGSGTTTLVASRLGLEIVATDLNPIMCVVARARLAGPSDIDAARRALEAHVTDNVEAASLATAGDPLAPWLGPKTISMVRTIIQTTLHSDRDDLRNGAGKVIERLNISQCLVIVAAFLAVKKLIGAKRGSNPTWSKPPSDAKRCSFSRARLNAALQIELASFGRLRVTKPDTAKVGKVSIFCASSDNLPIANESIDFILTSPPYCTRIDYAVATRLELAILGIEGTQVDVLRRKLLGTTAIRTSNSEIDSKWGAECSDILNFVKNHPSHGSASYYFKNILQYFDSLFASIEQMARVLKQSSFAAVVLQSSYYKERQIDLSLIFAQMAEKVGLNVQCKKTYPAKISMARLNSHSPRYRKHEIDTEDLLILRKG